MPRGWTSSAYPPMAIFTICVLSASQWKPLTAYPRPSAPALNRCGMTQLPGNPTGNGYMEFSTSSSRKEPNSTTAGASANDLPNRIDFPNSRWGTRFTKSPGFYAICSSSAPTPRGYAGCFFLRTLTPTASLCQPIITLLLRLKRLARRNHLDESRQPILTFTQARNQGVRGLDVAQ